MIVQRSPSLSLQSRAADCEREAVEPDPNGDGDLLCNRGRFAARGGVCGAWTAGSSAAAPVLEAVRAIRFIAASRPSDPGFGAGLGFLDEVSIPLPGSCSHCLVMESNDAKLRASRVLFEGEEASATSRSNRGRSESQRHAQRADEVLTVWRSSRTSAIKRTLSSSSKPYPGQCSSILLTHTCREIEIESESESTRERGCFITQW